MPRLGIGLLAICVASCQTTTTTTRTEPAIEKVEVTARRYEPLPVTVVAGRHVTDVSRVGFLVMRPEKCIETTTTTHKAVVTHTTVVKDAERDNAKTIQLAGAAVAGLGLVGGVAAAQVTIYEPSKRDGEAFVPVADQQGFSLLPVGVAVAVLSVLAGAPAIAAPWIVSAQEGEVSQDERTEQVAEAESAACAREIPVAGEVTLHVPGSEPRVVGALNAGRFYFDASILDDALVRSSSNSERSRVKPPSLTLVPDAVSVLFLVDGMNVKVVPLRRANGQGDGSDDAIKPLATLPTGAFPKLAVKIDAAMAKEAAENARLAAIEAAAEKKREAEEARLAAAAAAEDRRAAAATAWAQRFGIGYEVYFSPEETKRMRCPRPQGCNMTIYRRSDETLAAQWGIVVDIASGLAIGTVVDWKASRALEEGMLYWLFGGYTNQGELQSALIASSACHGCEVKVGALSCRVEKHGSLSNATFFCLPTGWSPQDIR